MISVNDYEFRGLSTETKPTKIPGTQTTLESGSRFVETDTGNRFDWNGSAWVASVASDSSVSLSGTGADNSTNSTSKLPVLAAKATAADPAWTEGRQVPLSVDLAGRVRFVSAAAVADDSPYTPGVGTLNPIGFMFDDVAPDSVDEGDIGVGRMSANRNQYVTIRDAAGNERGVNVTANNAQSVEPNGAGINVAATTTVVVSGAGNVDAAVAAVAGLRLVGFSITEDAGTPASAELRIVHGATAAGGTEVFTVTLTANESTREWFGPDGIAMASGISINRVSGTTKLTLFTKTVA